MSGFADRHIGDLVAAGQILYCLPDLGERLGVLSHCLSQVPSLGLRRLVQLVRSCQDGLHGILLLLRQLGQSFGFPEQSFQVLSFHFRQDPGPLHVSFVGRLGVGCPVQCGAHTGSVAKGLVCQAADLLHGRAGDGQQLVQVALKRYNQGEFLADGRYQRHGALAHCLSDFGGDAIEPYGDLLGGLGIPLGLFQFFDQFPCLGGSRLQMRDCIRRRDFDTLGDLLGD